MQRRLVVLLLVALSGLLPGVAHAQTAENELAEKWSPILLLQEQEEMCGGGEPYEPVDVDVVLDNREVAFRGPWDKVNVVKVAPTVDDLARGLPGYHLDFPGEALSPSCDYEEWQQRLSAVSEPTIYARVVREPATPRELALQYWFFYVYNDFNNKHEGDWEMIQLNFDAASPDEALSLDPVELGYSQHEGAERAAWGDEKLTLVDGTHPVVYPAAGSHANFFTSALFLGRSAAQGVGCDDATGPHREIRPRVAVIPSARDDYLRAFPWLGFEGRWGELEAAFYNGPTGPNDKTQWTQPITWAEEQWRDEAFKVPGGNALLPAATDFFCQAVGAGSSLLTTAARNPQGGLFLLAALLGVLVWGVTRTRWTPGTPLRLRRRRTTGQILTASRRLYGSNFGLFAGIGLVFLPIAIGVAGLQAVLFFLTSLDALTDSAGESSSFVSAFVFGISLIFNLIGLGIVQAVVARAIVTIDEGGSPRALTTYRLALRRERLRELVLTVSIIAGVTIALTLTFFLIPLAVWRLVRWSLTGQALEIERLGARASLARSSELVRGRFWRTGLLVLGIGVVATVSGPLIGGLAILGTDAAFWVANVISGIIYVFAFPFVAVVTTYIYSDLRVRNALEPEPLAAVLPEERDGTTPEPAG